MSTTTEDSDRHFLVTSGVTWRDEIDGRTRRYDGTPISWTIVTENDSSTAILTQDTAFLTQDEAIECLEKIEQEYPEGKHHIRSVPDPESARVLPPGVQYKQEMGDFIGYVYPQDADREGWEVDGKLVKEVTLELPLDLTEQIEEAPMEAREYIGRLQDAAEGAADAISEAPPSSTNYHPF